MAELEERARRAEHEAERERRLAAAEERTRIARDLHDSAGHAINVILVHAGLGRMRAESDQARTEFETIEQVARETVGEIDQLIGILREDGAGNGEVEPPPGLAALDALVERHRAAGLEVEVSRRRRAVRPFPPAPTAPPTGSSRRPSRTPPGTATAAPAVEIGRGAGRLELSVTNPLPAGARRPRRAAATASSACGSAPRSSAASSRPARQRRRLPGARATCPRAERER